MLRTGRRPPGGHRRPLSLPSRRITPREQHVEDDARLGFLGPENGPSVAEEGDELFARVAARLLADPAVDSAVISCVPLTGELDTLPSTTGHDEDLDGAQAIAPRLVDLWHRTAKPWVAVVDGGHQYDPLVSRLRQGGIPVFRTVDRAMEILELYGRWAAGDATLATMREDQG